MKTADLTGEWLSAYTYRDGAESYQHIITLEANDAGLLIGTAIGEDGSHLTLEVRYDAKNHVLTGTFQEITSRTGAYKGDTFRGAIQFILNADMDSARGKWVGFNRARDDLNTGTWTLERRT